MWFLPAQHYAIAVLAVIVSVCLSVCHKSCSTKTATPRITQAAPYDSTGTLFSYAKNLGEIPKWRKIQFGRFKSAIFDQYLAISQQEAQLSSRDPRDALYQLKCCSTVVRLTQTDLLLA